MKNRFFTLLICSLVFIACKNKSKENEISLVTWKATECNNSHNPYLLKNSFTSVDIAHGHTLITVNFSDNCCSVFKPSIQFKNNKLFLKPYKESLGNCDCNCCFSIQFDIAGLVGKKYKVYFDGDEIKRSGAVEKYQGKVINKQNQYGVKEGVWMSFYEDGSIKEIAEYAESKINKPTQPIWEKHFYPSGSISFFSRKDTTDTWFEGGQLESQNIEYNIEDTIYTKALKKYKNGWLEEKSMKKFYPPLEFKTVYEEKYFKNGRPRFIYGRDTSYYWYESGEIESKQYNTGSIKYSKTGVVMARFYHWKQKGSQKWGDLDHMLDVTFEANGRISRIFYRRDEIIDGSILYSPFVRPLFTLS